jgi:adenylate cyclase class 2
MVEIELKAHVADPGAVRRALDRFAKPLGAVEKRDQYWKLTRPGAPPVQVRLRTETTATAVRQVVTYKRKEVRTDAAGTAFEVNQEEEFSLGAGEPFLRLLSDIGFAPAFQKVKHVEQWRAGKALAELCEVPPLGFFLEIEVLSETDDAATVEEGRAELEEVLAGAGISRDNIEKRYYSELLGF